MLNVSQPSQLVAHILGFGLGPQGCPDLFCVQVLSPQEVNPPIGGDLRLRDVEDADTAEITVSAPLLKRYKANLAAYCDRLRAFCARRDITLLTVETSTPVETVILDYMRSRGLLR